MIHKITISNFFSIREPLEVSFEASKEKQYGEDWIVKKGNVRLLKAIFLYGSNGSGKTNILCALDFLRHVILSTPKDVDSKLEYLPFVLDPECLNKDTNFDVIFFINETRYRYQISITPDKFVSEELRVFNSGNSSKLMYSRKFNEEQGRSVVRFGTCLNLTPSQKKTVEDATTKNISVLAAYSAKNLSCPELDRVRNYFKYNFYKIYNTFGNDHEVASALKDDNNLKNLLVDLLRSFHSNIVDIQVDEETRPIPEEARQMLMQLRTTDEEKEQISIMKCLTKFTGRYIHKTTLGEFSLQDNLQSEGTRNFIRHIVLFYKAIKCGWLLALDEFGAGLQAKTQNLLLDFFLKFSRNSQMIVATQSLGFLDYLMMRRDALNIVSKDDLGQSHIDNKTIRTIHKNIKLRKAYIDGRFTTIDPNEPDIDLETNKNLYTALIFGLTRKEVISDDMRK